MTSHRNDHEHDPQHHAHDHPDGRPAVGAAEAAARILEEAALGESRRFHLNRQLWLALQDLGVLGTVGRDWVTAHEDTFSFGELGHDQVRRLVNRLQELTRLVDVSERPAPLPVDGQTAFRFEPRTAPIPLGSSHHPLQGVWS